MPTIHSDLLNNDLNWTDGEISSGKKWLKWEEMTIDWEKIELTWDEVFLLLEIKARMGGNGGYSYKEYVDSNPWNQVKKEHGEKNTKKLIKIFCRVNGIEYEQTKKPLEEVNISINEFERFVNETISVKVNF